MPYESKVQFRRPVEGFRFANGGLKTNATPDSCPPAKYPFLQNVRSTRNASLHTRPGLSPLSGTSGKAVTDIASYSGLNTDNLPRYLYIDQSNNVWLGQPPNQLFVGSLSGPIDFSGASLIPFRPAQSPTPWIYIANGSDYQKFSAPAPSTDAVTAQKVGIAEPQSPPDAAVIGVMSSIISAQPGYTPADIAGAVTGTTRITDTVQSAFPDPAISTGLSTVGVSASQVYTRQMFLTINSVGQLVQDVYPAQPLAISISAIYYFSGTTGHCVVVPANLGTGPGDAGNSVNSPNPLSTIRRGSLIKFSGSSEVCLVWNVTRGPDGTICFETSTVGTHTTAETFTQPPAIQVNGVWTAANIGQSISALSSSSSLTGAGIGTLTATLASSPFTFGQFSFQSDDYVHLSINVSLLASINEIKLLFDVGDGSFTQNFYYYTARASDIEAGVQNTLTQLGAAQLVSQRATIDEETAAASHNQLSTSSSAQLYPGDAQWSEIIFPISQFTRVGNDQAKSLLNAGKVQVLVNTNAGCSVAIGAITIFGGFSADVGTNGAPYRYRIRPRSSLTGVKGNPSPETRYGINPRREQVQVQLPGIYADTQVDTWDIFRYGGTVTSWRKIGQATVSSTQFIDNYSDDAALAGEELEFDNLEPWPTVDVPFNATATVVAGTIATVTVPVGSNVTRYLPGNFVQVQGGNVYTLWARPTLLNSTTALFQFVENAGSLTNAPIIIYEPTVARQFLPYMWGPDAEGTVFAVGDPLRPGTLSFAKNYAPDSAPDSYNIEITQPSEPLLGGEVLNGLSFVASPERWWALYPQPTNPVQRYSVIQQPLPRGLAAPLGHCTDGQSIYWWAKDGIWSSSKGSLTDEDLYNLFPHDGVPGNDYTSNNHTISAPDYAVAAAFRLTFCDGYLYAVYIGNDTLYHTLTLDTRTGAWCYDAFNFPVSPTIYYHPPQQAGPLLTNTIGSAYPLLIVGGFNGSVYQQVPNASDAGQPINVFIDTFEFDGGDVRAGEQWGDLYLDATINALEGMLVQPLSLNAPVATVTTLPTAVGRQQIPVSVGGAITADFLGIELSWADTYASPQTQPSQVYVWQPSFVAKPETIVDRFTDWLDAGTPAAKYVQGFLLHADTANAIKSLGVRDSDTMTLHTFTPAVQFNGEGVQAFSFVTPFVAHMLRLEPLDSLPWRLFDWDLVFEPTPEAAETWQTQGTAFGLTGYMHIRQVSPCYASTTNILLTITSYDGQSPQIIILPATGGAMRKVTMALTANKGSLYFFTATSSAPFQLFLDSWEVLVGQWQRQDSYLRYRNLGAPTGDQARL